MDLGLKGRKALVCASSRGLGKACATALVREGCSVVINGLDPERIDTGRQKFMAERIMKRKASRARRRAAARPRPCRPSGSACRRNSVMPAPTYAARRPAS